jgi:porin
MRPAPPLTRLAPLTSGFAGAAALAALLGSLVVGNSAARADDAAPAPTGFWTRPTLLGDLGGLRPALAKYGLTFSLSETSEVKGNVSGGIRQGAAYDGLTTMGLQLDTQQAFGWAGGTVNASALQIHGRALSSNYLNSLQTASGIEAERATRLWELWYQQSFWGGAADVKLGQQSIDNEFMTSTGSALYLNTMMGWPMVPSADLYGGGPAYPLSSLGIRLRGTHGPVTVLVGAFNDNPPGGAFANDPQSLDADGARFNLNTGTLTIAELQYAATPFPNLPGTYRFGGWYDSARFPDQRFDTSGLSLANPLSNGNPLLREGNYSLYGVLDQMLWTPDPKGARSLSAFVRMMGAPVDRNLIDFSVNAGLNLKAPLAGRDNDTAGIGFGLAHVSGRAADLDRDSGTFVRSQEVFFEATYQAQLAPWWLLQPDFQYTIRPGAGIADPNNPIRLIGDEAVFGLRTTITF